MIRREVGSDFFLITQTDHAALSGQLAQHFGGGRFARPSPRAITAVNQHDAGWSLHDDDPTLNDRHRPLDVFEVPRPLALQVWAVSADRAEVVDPYAGLLVSLHSLARSIYANTHLPAREKFDIAQMQAQFDLNKFQHREVERQEQLRNQLGFRIDIPLKHGLAEQGKSPEDDRIAFDFRLLQAMDLLSLCLCCTHLPAQETNEVLTAPDGRAIKLKIHRDVRGNLHVNPWPFDVKRLELQVPFRRLPARDDADVEDFRRRYRAATIELLSVVVMP
jgi:hypothetical protein